MVLCICIHQQIRFYICSGMWIRSCHPIKMHRKQLPAIRLNYWNSEALVVLFINGLWCIGNHRASSFSERLHLQILYIQNIYETNHEQTWKPYNVNIRLFHTFFPLLGNCSIRTAHNAECKTRKSIVLPLLVGVGFSYKR